MIWLLAACGPKEIPAHLRPDPPPVVATYDGDAGVIARWIAGDPLARTPGGPAADGDPTWRTALDAGSVTPGTPAVALARGTALGRVESLARASGRASGGEALATLYPVDVPTTAPDTWPRDPADAVGGLDAIRHAAEHRVLAGWLAGPGIPLEPVADALRAPQYDALRGRPVAELVLARAAGATCDEPTIEAGIADLGAATRLALQRATADSDKEQKAWATARDAAGFDGAPVGGLLARAIATLTPCAGSDLATGGALLAIEAARWDGTCVDPPCAALDRLAGMHDAAAWSDRLPGIAATWHVTALKEALDTFDVGRDVVVFGDGAPRLVDALLATGTPRIGLGPLLVTASEPSAWLALGRAVGVDSATTWSDVRPALVGRVEAQVAVAKATNPPADTRALLDALRVATRRP